MIAQAHITPEAPKQTATAITPAYSSIEMRAEVQALRLHRLVADYTQKILDEFPFDEDARPGQRDWVQIHLNGLVSEINLLHIESWLNK